MPRSGIPSYRFHKASGQAIVTLPDGFGGRRDVLLGKYRSAESQAEYERVIAEWLVSGKQLPDPIRPSHNITVNELVLTFWRHVENYYRKPDGTPTSEVQEYKCTLRTLRALYGQTAARNFGPLALKALRQKMIEAWPCSPRVQVGRGERTHPGGGLPRADGCVRSPPRTIRGTRNPAGASGVRGLGSSHATVRPPASCHDD